MSSEDPNEQQRDNVTQENYADSEMSAEGFAAGRDVNVNQQLEQENDSALQSFPARDSGTYNFQLSVFDSLLSLSPLDATQLHLLAILLVGSGLIGFVVSLQSFLPSTIGGQFGLIPFGYAVPLQKLILVTSILFLGVGYAYGSTRDQAKCPQYETEMALHRASRVYPEISDSETTFGERTYECTRCDFETSAHYSEEK